VGSMLLYPDGCLQEAGGAIWQDGSGWNIGRLSDPQGCDYQFVREVDYCSGASFAVPLSLWRQLNGFDLRYAPAYYEDTDFAFRVREAGLKVIYTPFSQLVHFEGISSGTDTSSGVKRYQAVNQSTFAKRWQSQLQDRHPPETPELATYGTGVRPQLLWLDALTPTPDRDSGSIDALNFLTVAKEMGWDVSFIPTSNLLKNGRYTEELQRLGVRCLYWPHINSIETYLETYGHLFDVVVLSRVSVAESLLPIVRRLAPQASVGFNTVDLHFLRQQRQKEVVGNLASMDIEATRKAELALIEHSDLTISISDVEAATIRDLVPSATVKAVPIARTIPGRTTPFAERRDICFLGGFNHDPNVDAVLYFVSEIWPLVAERLPDCNFLIAGADMPDRIHQLQSDRIQTLGYVSNLDDLFERVRLSVAPLRYGAGLKGKVISSFSYGVPAVCTPIAVEGMELSDSYTNQLVADLSDVFANCIVQAYLDTDRWSIFSDLALACAQQQFSLNAVVPTMQAVLMELKQMRDSSGSQPTVDSKQ
ncbi:MAG: glycosyltransferase, partial [Cyanobacteria bacterium P01_E01_bin.34]